MAHTKRFADMLLGNYALHNNEEKQVQFGAFTAEPETARYMFRLWGQMIRLSDGKKILT